MKHDLQLLISLAVARLDSNAPEAPEGLEATRIMGKVNRTQGEKKVRGREESCEGGREEWLPCRQTDGREGQRSGITEKPKEKGREGKKGGADSYFSTVARGVGCNPNLTLTTHGQLL